MRTALVVVRAVMRCITRGSCGGNGDCWVVAGECHVVIVVMDECSQEEDLVLSKT